MVPVVVRAVVAIMLIKLSSVLIANNVRMRLDVDYAQILVSATIAYPITQVNRPANTPKSFPKLSSSTS